MVVADVAACSKWGFSHDHCRAVVCCVCTAISYISTIGRCCDRDGCRMFYLDGGVAPNSTRVELLYEPDCAVAALVVVVVGCWSVRAIRD